MKAAALTKAAHYPNQDNFTLDTNLKLFAVFDGMGGYEGGAVAAKLAASVVWEEILSHTFQKQMIDLEKLLKAALISAAKAIVDDGQIHKRPDQGTTATIVKILNSKAVIANVGDSRCYGLDKNGKLIRLTADHGILDELLKKGQIPEKIAVKIDQAKNLEDLEADELSIFNQRNIVTNALSQYFDTDNIYFSDVLLKDFKMFVLTSDGVHDNLTDEEIKTILLKQKSTKAAAKNLIDTAYKVSRQNTLRSKPDDITAVVISLAS